MQLGRLDVCLRVQNVGASREFYEGLGFRRVEGDDAEGWAVVAQGESRIGLFEPHFMTSDFSLNFRGGNIATLVEGLQAQGYRFAKEPKVKPDGSGSATLHDPDGYVIFLDSTSDELRKA